MKLPLDQRGLLADRILTLAWACEYWSRDEQMFACAEGWCLTVFGERERITKWEPPANQTNNAAHVFADDLEALAYVIKRAEEGSPLHCRALVLHMACVLKNGY